MSLPVSVPAGPPQDEPGRPVVWLNWGMTVRWLTGTLRFVARPEGRVELAPPWMPGAHWALVGPTGEGKTTVAVALLRLRDYVLALDPKGQDETLAASGYQRVTGLPPRKAFPRDIQRALDEGRPARLIVGSAARTDEEDAALQKLMREAITYARHSGGWTLYVDEFELLSSQRMFNQGPAIERMLITARRDKSTVMTSFQAQAWVSKHATRQATFVVMFPTRDRDMIKAVAQAMGRSWQGLAQAVDLLPEYHVIIVPKKIRAPMVITSAPKAGKCWQPRSSPPATSVISAAAPSRPPPPPTGPPGGR